ncbi:MAG: carboxypeptidase regulatory-like domain-containing protein [Saprospiraceae bacterium]|nr:carboxypeptidase regulatory-like domain-containing protein [Saprospiraceae bacterium]MBK9630950.1 carboxypeptidase regulatory-like domain-containing protein [Saprospiraceae bacterium]
MFYQINKRNLFFICLFHCLIFFQCRENQDSIISDGNDRPVLVSSGVFGRVFDPSGNPLENVEVSFDRTSVLTDKNGVFLLKDQLMNKQGAHIKFKKSSYFEVYRTVIPVKGQVVNLETRLIKRSLTKTIQSAQGGPVESNGNASVIFQANSFQNENSQPYSGSVRVYTYYLDPLADQTLSEMPGNLTGRDKDGKYVVLRTIGMLKVELEDEMGNPLKLNPNLPAEMKVPIPSSLQSKAEEFIPLWYFDQTKGSWIEEGKAKVNGSYYVGNAAHFTFWNWDFPFKAINLKFRLVDELGNPLSGFGFDILDLTQWGHGSGATNNDGTFEGKIPANTSFEMVGLECNSSIIKTFQSQNIDLDLGDVLVPNIKTFNLLLQAVDCNNQAVSNGYVNLTEKQTKSMIYIPLDANGNINTFMSYCGTVAYHLKIVDITNLKEKTDVDFDVNNQSIVDLGEIKVCEELKDFVRINCLGKDNLYSAYVDGSAPGPIQIFAFGPDSTHFRMNILDISQSAGNPNSISLNQYIPNVALYCASNCNTVNYQIIHIGPQGGQIKGTFSGSLLNLDALGPQGNINFSGEFSILRN